ncbi:MAG: Deoxyhypusine synthase [Candidatus Alkanophagales archaeon MCA70_species_1]|nr:Deoxyhypusine synthase [Candidatus Alkanophaga volatiphilum]
MKITGVKVRERMSVDELVRELERCAFGARRLAVAVDIYNEMLERGAVKFLGLAGALVPAGLRGVISEMLRSGFVDVLVTTGANIVHDIIEALGGHHYLTTLAVESIDDAALRTQSTSRIYDVLVRDEDFVRLEEFVRSTLEELNTKGMLRKPISIRGLLVEFGKRLDDEDSILRVAVEKGIPVFCPAFADSMLGLHASLFRQTAPLVVDAIADMQELIGLCYDAELAGAIILGGGVPKNFIFQAMLLSPKGGFDYVIQITTDTPHAGGLSGATPDEAKSWGKVKSDAKTVVVYCDVTIALPIIVAALKERRRR